MCLREAGPLADEFRAAGFDVEVLGRSGRFDLRTLPRLIRYFRSSAYRRRAGDTSSPCFSGPRAYRRTAGPGAGEHRCGTRHGPDIGR